MSEDSQEPSPRLLAAYLSDECTAAESAEILRWARAHPHNAARLEALRAAWAASRDESPEADGAWSADAIWTSIASRMGDETSQIRLVRNSGPHAIPRGAFATRRNVAGWAALAASLVLVAALGVEYGRNVRAERTRPAPVDPGREYRTSVGQRASVTLPDGSAFELGPASRLRIPPGYGAPNRIVELEGDGYFNVVHDEQHPFAVRTARTIIRDLGTRFVVRARPAERRVEVAVADGQVAVAPASPERVSAGRDTSALTLTAGQAALVDDRGMQRLGKQAVTAQFAWTRGEFVFDHVRVPVVLNELSRWYGTRFVLADASLDTVRLTTTLRGETMLEALVVLEAALDVDARVDGDRVTLTRHSTKDR